MRFFARFFPAILVFALLLASAGCVTVGSDSAPVNAEGFHTGSSASATGTAGTWDHAKFDQDKFGP